MYGGERSWLGVQSLQSKASMAEGNEWDEGVRMPSLVAL